MSVLRLALVVSRRGRFRDVCQSGLFESLSGIRVTRCSRSASRWRGGTPGGTVSDPRELADVVKTGITSYRRAGVDRDAHAVADALAALDALVAECESLRDQCATHLAAWEGANERAEE